MFIIQQDYVHSIYLNVSCHYQQRLKLFLLVASGENGAGLRRFLKPESLPSSRATWLSVQSYVALLLCLLKGYRLYLTSAGDVITIFSLTSSANNGNVGLRVVAPL